MQPIARIEDLRPGDIGLGPIGGLAGFGVGLGQLILGEGWRLSQDDEVRIRHTAIVSAPGRIVEAVASGARERPLDAGHWSTEWAWVRLPEDYPCQAHDAAYVAQAMAEAKVPYSPASYLALSAWRIGFSGHRLERWINRRHQEVIMLPSGRRATAGLPCEAICSVLVDQAWTLTGKKIMHGVPHQCVTPAALARRLRLDTPGAVWAFPGR